MARQLEQWLKLELTQAFLQELQKRSQMLNESIGTAEISDVGSILRREQLFGEVRGLAAFSGLVQNLKQQATELAAKPDQQEQKYGRDN